MFLEVVTRWLLYIKVITFGPTDGSNEQDFEKGEAID